MDISTIGLGVGFIVGALAYSAGYLHGYEVSDVSAVKRAAWIDGAKIGRLDGYEEGFADGYEQCRKDLPNAPKS